MSCLRTHRFLGVLLLAAGLCTGLLAGVVLGGMGMARYLAPAASTSWLSAPEMATRKASAPQVSGDTRLLIYSRRSGLSPRVSDWILSLTALSAIVLVFTLIVPVYKKATLLIRKPFDACRDYSVHQTSSLDELTAVWKIDCAAYGESNVPFATLQAWWQIYPQGHYLVKKRGKIIGGLGLWPVSRNTYHQMRRGTLTEGTLTIMGRRNPEARKEHWYISGIVIAAEHRKVRALSCLLNRLVERRRMSQTHPEQIQVGAIPISEEGLRLLMRHGFPLFPWLPLLSSATTITRFMNGCTGSGTSTFC